MADSIDFFKKLASTEAFRKLILNPLDRDCPVDGNVLDMAINKYINPTLEVCTKCKIKSTVANKILNKAAEGLDVTPDEFKELLIQPYYRRALKSLVIGIKKYGFQKPFLPSNPFLVIWNFTNLCNSKCKHCYQNAGEKAVDELNLEQQKKVIDNLSDWGITFLVFSGGEPLVHPDFFELAEYAAKKGIAPGILTNGTMITRETAKKLVNVGIAYAEVSLDSLDSKEHDEFRGLEGAWKRSVEGMKNLIEVKIPTAMVTFIHKNNYKNIPEFVNFAKEMGAGFWGMLDYKPAGRAKNLDIDMSPDQREEALKILSEATLNEIKNRNEKKPFILLDANTPQFGRKMKELSRKYGFVGHYGFLINNSLLLEIVGGCAVGRAYIGLQQNGDISPCVYMPDLVIGNVLKDDLDHLWSNNQILKDLRDRDGFEGYCPKCENEYICGGCRARAYDYLGDVTKPDIGCIHNKEHWEKYMRSRS